MAPKTGPKKRKDTSEDNVFREEEEPKQEQINLGDAPSLKRALDDAVIQAVSEAGCKIDNTYTDLKIVIGLLACGVACLAQFYPKKYPHNFWLLVGCVVVYVVLSILMTVVASVYEKDSIALTRAIPGGLPALSISTRMPRYQDAYTLRIAPRNAAAAAASSGSGASGGISLTKSVGAYFHEDGYLATSLVKRDTEQLLRQLGEEKSK